MTRFGIITDVKNPQYNENGSIDCVITLNNEEMPFTAVHDDCEEHGRIIYEMCKNGKFGEVKPFSS